MAQFLAGHPRIERVFYPGLPSHPYHDVARRTMRGFGGLVTFLVRDADWRATARVVDAVKIPRIGPSLGGVESLIEQPLVMSYYECPAADRQRYGIPDNMIRLACGIENPEYLVADLKLCRWRVASGSVVSGQWLVVSECTSDKLPMLVNTVQKRKDLRNCLPLLCPLTTDH